MSDNYKQIPSSCTLSKLTAHDALSATTSTSTPPTTPSTSELSSESASLNNVRRESETSAVLESTVKKVVQMKKRTGEQHNHTTPNNNTKKQNSIGSSDDSIELKNFSSSNSSNSNGEYLYEDDNGLQLLNDYASVPFLSKNNNANIKQIEATAIVNGISHEKLYYDELKTKAKKCDHLVIDVYQHKPICNDLKNSNGNNNEDNLDDDADDDLKFNYKTNVKSKTNYLIIIILLVVNLLNYADRFSIAGVLREIQAYYQINDAMSGLLQTVFICSYMLLAPLFGYLGDRYNRKYIIIFGITFWSLMTLAGSFVPRNMFWLFAIIRSLVGIGEASYSCVAPTIIGDLFTDEMRTLMLAVFYLAVPVGSGLGYIIGSNVASAFSDWRWALRVTPPLGLVCIILLIILVEEPKRGGAEGSFVHSSKNSFMSDVFYLLKNKTFMWTTMGFTFASFVMGGLSWWVPTYVEYAIYSNGEKPHQIPLMFGIVTSIAGLIGVCLSSAIAPKMRRYTKHADPLVCAVGSLIAVPALFVCILIPRVANMYLYWLVVAVGISGMCLCWTLVADITLYVVQPTRRSIASAMNILICHLLGDSVSPYIIGAISDKLRADSDDSYYNRFTALQVALYSGPFFAALSFAAYLFAAIYIEDDKKVVEEFIKKQKQLATPAIGTVDISDPNIGETQQLTGADDEDVSNESVSTVDQKLPGTPKHHVSPAKQHTISPNIQNLRNEAHLNLNYNHSNSNTMTDLLEASKL